MGPLGMFIKEKDVATYKCTLAMGEGDLLILLNQLKLKVVEIIQIRMTLF
jgi:hypothetical protein